MVTRQVLEGLSQSPQEQVPLGDVTVPGWHWGCGLVFELFCGSLCLGFLQGNPSGPRGAGGSPGAEHLGQ